MSDIKPGDRVHVEFDGSVCTAIDDAIEVRVDGGTPGGLAWVLPAQCTVIVPPVKVGDTVTDDNIGQLPVGSVIARDGFAPLCRNHGGLWECVGALSYDDRECVDPKSAPLVALRIGDAS